MNLKIDQTFSNGLRLSLNLNSGVYVITDDSATGKSYLFKILKRYCKEHDIKYRLIDYNDVDSVDFSTDYVKSQCDKYDVIALDNADMYMEPGLYSSI